MHVRSEGGGARTATARHAKTSKGTSLSSSGQHGQEAQNAQNELLKVATYGGNQRAYQDIINHLRMNRALYTQQNGNVPNPQPPAGPGYAAKTPSSRARALTGQPASGGHQDQADFRLSRRGDQRPMHETPIHEFSLEGQNMINIIDTNAKNFMKLQEAHEFQRSKDVSSASAVPKAASNRNGGGKKIAQASKIHVERAETFKSTFAHGRGPNKERKEPSGRGNKKLDGHGQTQNKQHDKHPGSR